MYLKLLAAVAPVVSGALVSGCATGVLGSPRRICYDAGYQPGTQEFSDCWKSVRNDMFKSDATAMGIGAAAAVAVSRNNSADVIHLPNSTLTANRWLPESSIPTSASAVWLCPNGTYVFGLACYIAPNGSYVGVPAQMAPDGTWVGGTPKMAPNGRYLGGGGQVTICPDGSYVAGSKCQLMPNGTYLGVR